MIPDKKQEENKTPFDLLLGSHCLMIIMDVYTSQRSNIRTQLLYPIYGALIFGESINEAAHTEVCARVRGARL